MWGSGTLDNNHMIYIYSKYKKKIDEEIRLL